MKVDRAVCSATGVNKRKYLHNSSLRLLVPCAIVSQDALIDFIGHYLKRDRHKYKELGWKKSGMKLYLEIFSFIVDIRPDSEYPSDEQNKLFSFSIKAILKLL